MKNIKIEDYYLDLDKVNGLEKHNSDRIHGYYIDLLMPSSSPEMKMSIFNTLNSSGYLLNINTETRDKNIKNVLDEN